MNVKRLTGTQLSGQKKSPRGISSPRDVALLELIQATILNAWASPFYRNKWGSLPELTCAKDLQKLPVVTRDDLSRAGTTALVDGTIPTFIGLTSGTSFAADRSPLYHYHSDEERTAMNHVLENIYSDIPKPRPMGLRLITSNHGIDFQGGRPGLFAVPFEKEFHFSVVLDLLSQRFSFDGYSDQIQSLAAPLNKLKVLTSLCAERKITRQFDIRLITTFAWHLTPRWREFIENCWQAPINEVYGMSEVPGLHAKRCSVCKYFHFSPSCAIEFLDLESNDVSANDVGRLVATALYPLSQVQPFVRYDTGDIFQRRLDCCPTGRPGYEFLGRRGDVMIYGNKSILLARTSLLDNLDAHPDVATTAHPKGIFWDLEYSTGEPIFRVRAAKTEVIFDVELRWPPRQYPRRADTLHSELIKTIGNCIIVSGGTAPMPIRLELYAPGELSRQDR